MAFLESKEEEENILHIVEQNITPIVEQNNTYKAQKKKRQVEQRCRRNVLVVINMAMNGGSFSDK